MRRPPLLREPSMFHIFCACGSFRVPNFIRSANQGFMKLFVAPESMRAFLSAMDVTTRQVVLLDLSLFSSSVKREVTVLIRSGLRYKALSMHTSQRRLVRSCSKFHTSQRRLVRSRSKFESQRSQSMVQFNETRGRT